MSIILLIFSILFLLLLIVICRIPAFVALILTALTVGLAKKMPYDALLKAITNGVGSTLGGVVLVLGFGIMLGSVLAETGAASRISTRLIQIFGVKNAKIALALTGFSVGLAMFYNAGFVVLIPLVFSVAANTGLPVIYLGVAMASALSVTHGFTPPHPGPTAICQIFKADMGKTLLLGIVAAIPALICGGIIFPEFLKNIKANPPAQLSQLPDIQSDKLPNFSISLLCALLPVLLMGAATVAELTLSHDNPYLKSIKFIGDPSVSMLLGMLCALLFLGKIISKNGSKNMDALMQKSSIALSAATGILLIIASGGAFKQVLLDSDIGTDIANVVKQVQFPPLILGWLVATVVRIAIGSATVAGLTAAGIVQPLIATDPSVSAELMVLSVGAGSLMCSHVNDTGFWMFKEYFGLSLADTFRSWTLMETIIGIVGLVTVLGLDFLV